MRISRFPSLVDDVNVRLIAGVVLATGLVAVLTQQWWLYAVLAADFTLRAALGPSASPVAELVRRWLRPRVPLPMTPTAGPPKRFAASIGAVLTWAIAALWGASLATASPGALTAAVVLAGVMVLFPALEAIWGICAGCIAFGWLMRLGLVPDDVCVECADISRRVRSAQAAT